MKHEQHSAKSAFFKMPEQQDNQPPVGSMQQQQQKEGGAGGQHKIHSFLTRVTKVAGQVTAAAGHAIGAVMHHDATPQDNSGSGGSSSETTNVAVVGGGSKRVDEGGLAGAGSSKRDDEGGRGGAGAGIATLLGIWTLDGFGFRKLEAALVSDVYLALGRQRWALQRSMQLLQQAEGFVSLDHVMEVAKRVKGDSKAMLIVCGAAGNVLDWWFVTSTSLTEVLDDLRMLNERQAQPVLMVTVDDPVSMERSLKEAFPQAEIRMDVGHIIFSRIGKRLDKTHVNYREFGISFYTRGFINICHSCLLSY